MANSLLLFTWPLLFALCTLIFSQVCSAADNDCEVAQTAVARPTLYSAKIAEEASYLSAAASGKVLILGDSIAARWPSGDLVRVFGSDTVNFGVGGDRIENTSFIVEQIPNFYRPLSIIVVSGTNNVNHDSECAFRRRLRALFSTLRKKFPSTPIFVMNILPKGQQLRAFAGKISTANQIIEESKNGFNIRVVDGFDALRRACGPVTPCEQLEPDRLHPSALGYQTLDAALYQALTKNAN